MLFYFSLLYCKWANRFNSTDCNCGLLQFACADCRNCISVSSASHIWTVKCHWTDMWYASVVLMRIVIIIVKVMMMIVMII